jgi:16S rRNA (uracil1498-N3)-methyltransferase
VKVFLLAGCGRAGNRVEIRGSGYHYLARVRRMKPGDRFLGADAEGGTWRCTVTSVQRDRLEVSLDDPVEIEGERSSASPGSGAALPSLCLLQCLPKGRKMELIVRQATEAGVRRIVPAVSRYSLSRPAGAEELRGKRLRWERIARAAAQQSGGGRLPVIDAPAPLQRVLEEGGPAAAGEVRVFFHERRAGEATLHGCLAGDVGSVSILVGPEGGLAHQEVQLLQRHGYSAITVGSTVLRTETAALFAIAAVQAVLQERHSWRPVS